MTFSILARDPDTGELGGAAATGNLAVGAWVLRAGVEAGLAATQGYSVSTLWGDEALCGLGNGEHPERLMDRLISHDAGSGYRQLILLDTQGNAAGWTGENNTDLKGHTLAPNLAVAGNWLDNENVLTILKDTFVDAQGSLAGRLLRALEAAAKAGSDARGTVSAAIKIVAPTKPLVDLRIDHSETPISDLRALFEMTKAADYRAFVDRLPTTRDPQRC